MADCAYAGQTSGALAAGVAVPVAGGPHAVHRQFRQQHPAEPSAPAANSAIKMQLRLRLSFELALLSVLCSVSPAQHQVNLSTGCGHCATSTGGVQALLVLRSSPELALLSRMSSYWTYASTLCTFQKHKMLLALLYMMSMY